MWGPFVVSQYRFPIVHIMFLAGDIGPKLFGASTQKSLRSVLLPTDTRHVLKFLKYAFRGVNRIDSRKSHCKTDAAVI